MEQINDSMTLGVSVDRLYDKNNHEIKRELEFNDETVF